MYFWFYATWAELDMLVAMCSLCLPYYFYGISFFIENWKLGQKTLHAAKNDWFLGLDNPEVIICQFVTQSAKVAEFASYILI